MTIKPNPGSPEAVALGCRCPRVDNAWRRGLCRDNGGKPTFVISEACEMHWPEATDRLKEGGN